MRNFIITIFVLVYFAGCSHFNKDVRDACTHGNCKSGWSSKYNKSEQAIATLWMFGYPVIAFFTHLIFFAESVPSKKHQKSSPNFKPVETKSSNTSIRNYSFDGNESSEKITIHCPLCGSQMKTRVARKGKYAGNKFWGCINYSRCKGMINQNDKIT